jgi:hypothetical protein
MPLTDFLATTDALRVEVSGGDQDNIYFVEKSTLDWDEFAGHTLLPGAP